MNYPPGTSRSCNEADGRSDRSGGSGSATSATGVYGTLSGNVGSKWSANNVLVQDTEVIGSSTHDRLLDNCKKWSLGLDYLLHDSEGVALFKSYLEFEGCSNLLDFWFACQGFRSKVDPSDGRKITQIIKAIYRTYIRGVGSTSQQLIILGKSPQSLVQSRSDPIRLRSETRHEITEKISRKHDLDQTVFDKAQGEVEHFLRTTAYPAFLKSDVYIDFLQKIFDGSKFNTSSQCAVHSDAINYGFIARSLMPNGLAAEGGKLLPTLDEDCEFKSEELSSHNLASKQMCDYVHCQHCTKHHNQEQPHIFKNANSKGTWPYPVSVYTSTGSAPLTMENLQMSRFYRNEMSMLQSPFPNLNDPSQSRQVCELRSSGSSQNCGNYTSTRWVDTMCPSSNHRVLTHLLPAHPPNPYHISYAPVSARDSERHSLSSGARTDDTYSHTDSSSHDGVCYHLRQQHQRQPMNHRYPSPFQLSQNQSSHHTPHTMISQSFQTTNSHSISRNTLSDQPSNFPINHRNQFSGKLDDSLKISHKHHHYHSKRLTRRISGSRGPDKSRNSSNIPSNDYYSGLNQPEMKVNLTKPSNTRSYNLAEHDPCEFARILCDKLQRLLDSQLATERLDTILNETNTNTCENPGFIDIGNRPSANQPPISKGSKTSSIPVTLSNSSDGHISTISNTLTITTSTSVVSVTTSSITSASRTSGVGSAAPSILQRPWADKLLAAARVQHENTKENAQAILEYHCSRIWAASADRTPTTSGSSGTDHSSGGPNAGDEEGMIRDDRVLEDSPGLSSVNPLLSLSDSYVKDLDDNCFNNNTDPTMSDCYRAKTQELFMLVNCEGRDSYASKQTQQKHLGWNLEMTAREHAQ